MFPIAKYFPFCIRHFEEENPAHGKAITPENAVNEFKFKEKMEVPQSVTERLLN